jgi:hypothetical protein
MWGYIHNPLWLQYDGTACRCVPGKPTWLTCYCLPWRRISLSIPCGAIGKCFHRYSTANQIPTLSHIWQNGGSTEQLSLLSCSCSWHLPLKRSAAGNYTDSWGVTFCPVFAQWTTLSVQNIKNIFLILSCTPPFCPQNSLNSSGHGLYKVSKAFQRDAGSCWLQCFLQLYQVGCMSFGWWAILDTHWKLQRCSSWHKPVRLVPATITCSKAPKYFSCPFTLWMAHIHNPCLNCLKA